MLNEIWKPVKHYEDSYLISNYGRVKSIPRTLYKKDGVICGYVNEKYISQHDNGRGYLFVNLWKNNNGKREYVHRLVALSFIENPNNFPQVNHKDEDKQNNFVDNLEWCDSIYNNNYGTAKSRRLSTCRNNGVFEKRSNLWKTDENPAIKNPKTKDKNSYAKRVQCGGIEFDCIKDCAEYFNVSYSSMRGWVSGSVSIPKWFKPKNLQYI